MYEYADNRQLEDLIAQRIAWLRALDTWFQSAHHVVSGVSFSGDHANLYEKIYTSVQEEFDGAVEKGIGLTGNLGLACPMTIMKGAVSILSGGPSPSEMNPEQLAEAGLALEQAYLAFVDEMFNKLEVNRIMSLGLNDQLSSSANKHETFVYLLGQRAR